MLLYPQPWCNWHKWHHPTPPQHQCITRWHSDDVRLTFDRKVCMCTWSSEHRQSLWVEHWSECFNQPSTWKRKLAAPGTCCDIYMCVCVYVYLQMRKNNLTTNYKFKSQWPKFIKLLDGTHVHQYVKYYTLMTSQVTSRWTINSYISSFDTFC